MQQLFAYDSKLGIILSKTLDMIVGSILWLLCAIPLITIGNATRALIAYWQAPERRLSTFGQALIKQWWRPLGIWVSYVGLVGVLVINSWFCIDHFKSSSVAAPLVGFYLVVGILATGVWVRLLMHLQHRKLDWVFVQQCLYLSARHFIKTVLMIGIVLVSIFGLYLFPIAIIIVPALIVSGWLQLDSRELTA